MATSQCPLNYKMKEIDIKVPNIGDFTDVEVIEVLVNQGQEILKNLFLQNQQTIIKQKKSNQLKLRMSMNMQILEKLRLKIYQE